MKGIILVNKEQDYTSFDVVAIIRRILSCKKVGHLGTLDPMATGVLPILIGRATKTAQFMPLSDKEYIATFRCGYKSDTDDIWGEVLNTNSKQISEEELVSILPSFLGKQTQIPPMYSAKKVNGVKLYKLARQGIEIERKPVEIEIFSIDYLGRDKTGDFKIKVRCSEGTYIRTLICDIGQKAGSDTLMTSLVRTSSHGFDISNSHTLDEVEKICNLGEENSLLIPVSRIFNTYPQINLTTLQAFRFKNGGGLSLERIKSDMQADYYRVYDGDLFLGLGKTDFDVKELKPVYQDTIESSKE